MGSLLSLYRFIRLFIGECGERERSEERREQSGTDPKSTSLFIEMMCAMRERGERQGIYRTINDAHFFSPQWQRDSFYYSSFMQRNLVFALWRDELLISVSCPQPASMVLYLFSNCMRPDAAFLSVALLLL